MELFKQLTEKACRIWEWKYSTHWGGRKGKQISSEELCMHEVAFLKLIFSLQKDREESKSGEEMDNPLKEHTGEESKSK